MSYLFFDTETTGLPKNFDAPVTEAESSGGVTGTGTVGSVMSLYEANSSSG